MPDHKLLTIYLNDHLAGATAGVELARRALGSNRDTEFERPLERLAREVEDDRETLKQVMAELGVGADQVKQTFAWAAEKLGRLKLNGSLTGYSPLSRVVELEALSLGVEGKLAAWRVLERLAPGERRLAGFDFAALAARAERQRRLLERQRQAAADLAFGARRRARPARQTPRSRGA